MATAGVVEVDERADAQFDVFVRARLAELLRLIVAVGLWVGVQREVDLAAR